MTGTDDDGGPAPARGDRFTWRPRAPDAAGVAERARRDAENLTAEFRHLERGRRRSPVVVTAHFLDPTHETNYLAAQAVVINPQLLERLLAEGVIVAEGFER